MMMIMLMKILHYKLNMTIHDENVGNDVENS